VRDWLDKKGHFGVLVGKSLPQDREDRYLGLVQCFDPKPKRRLWELLRSQGLQMNQDLTFLTDCGATIWMRSRILTLFVAPQPTAATTFAI
jgi:hypothetical protein